MGKYEKMPYNKKGADHLRHPQVELVFNYVIYLYASSGLSLLAIYPALTFWSAVVPKKMIYVRDLKFRINHQFLIWFQSRDASTTVDANEVKDLYSCIFNIIR